ncbi:MAG: hypothetical protein Q8L86_15345, partial [Vicinamibacterales bacterium]|nr:hypothetical protein [Vicinamibacterales bacterium]
MTALREPRRRWRSRTAAAAWTVSTLGLVAFGAGLVYVTAGELLRAPAPTPPEVTRDVIVRHAEDAQGRRASFRILLFTDEFRWRLSSFDRLESGSGWPAFTDEMKAVLNQASEIICIGASSEELPAGLSPEAGRLAEERRAARRAEQIAVWVREAVSKPIPIRKLNVGHHVSTGGTPDTSDQRRVVIILVLDQDRDTDLDQALRAAMARESIRAPIFETLLTRYSLVAGKP